MVLDFLPEISVFMEQFAAGIEPEVVVVSPQITNKIRKVLFSHLSKTTHVNIIFLTCTYSTM
jgi:hypothetical protein